MIDWFESDALVAILSEQLQRKWVLQNTLAQGALYVWSDDAGDAWALDLSVEDEGNSRIDFFRDVHLECRVHRTRPSSLPRDWQFSGAEVRFTHPLADDHLPKGFGEAVENAATESRLLAFTR